MLVVTNQVLPSVTISNSECYDTTHQHFHFARGLVDFWGLVVTNFGRITDLNGNLRKLETAYLSHSRGAITAADPGAQTPRGGVFLSVTVAVPTQTCKSPQKPVFAQKKEGAKSEQ